MTEKQPPVSLYDLLKAYCALIKRSPALRRRLKIDEDAPNLFTRS